jgi:hypothetical protein
MPSKIWQLLIAAMDAALSCGYLGTDKQGIDLSSSFQIHTAFDVK